MDLFDQAGVRVDFPRISSCCGLPAVFAGDRAGANKTMRTSLALMEGPDLYDAYLVLCPSCGVTMVEEFEKLKEADAHTKTKAERIAAKIKSLSMCLEELGIKFRAVGDKKATYHTPCHLGRGMNSTAVPYLREILGDNFVPLMDTDVCCGFAGSYSVEFPGISSGILAKKIEHIKASGADILVTDCPGCVMQIKGGMLKNDLPIPVMHLSDYLSSLKIVDA